MRVDYTQLTGDNEAVGFGGISHNFTEQALVIFEESRKYLHIYAIDIDIVLPSNDIEDLPSVLGRDILDRWVMSYNKPANRITFRVKSSDRTIELT